MVVRRYSWEHGVKLEEHTRRKHKILREYLARYLEVRCALPYHLANNTYRARQEYNNILHRNSTMQAHFGRSGLNMLSFDPSREGALYLFDMSGRAEAKTQLLEDIPQLVIDFGDAVQVGQFYETIYNMTPSHMDDIHAAMTESPDVEVVTTDGGVRRRPNGIRADDTLRMKSQRTLFPLFLKSHT
jgi:hypothetical protein